MARYLLTLLFSFLIAQYGVSETWIRFKNHTVDLKKETNCKATVGPNWEDICDCCLIKNTDVRNKIETAAVARCEQRYNCRFQEDARTNINVAKSELERARNKFQAMTIIDIDAMQKPPSLPKDGVLEPHHVNGILRSLNDAGYLDLPLELFGEEDDRSERLRIKPLGDTAKGFFTGQLFTIRFDPFYLNQAQTPAQQYKILYILKETKKGVKEIRNLYRVSTSPLGNEKSTVSDRLFSPMVKSNNRIAHVAFDEVHFRFKTNGRTRYFSLLQTAPGMSLHRHLEAFGNELKNVTNDEEMDAKIEAMKTTFYDIGFGLSKLHQKYSKASAGSLLGKTYTHGDLHSENIFYDQETRQVTLIDNETFALSLHHPWSGINDLAELYLLHTVHTIAHAVSKQLTTNLEFGINDLLWHQLWKSLLLGYIDAYGDLTREDFQAVFSEVRREFYHGLSQSRIFRSPRSFNDQRKLKRFLPSTRRWQIKHHELRETFERVRKEGLKKYEI